MTRTVDDRLWHPDLNAVVDWGKVWDVGHQRYADKPEATWWHQATEAVNYYRAELPARHYPGKTVHFEVRDIQPRNGGHYFPRQEGDAAIWMFPGTMDRWLSMAEMKTQHGIRVLVEVDDNYTVPPAMPQLSSWLVKHEKGSDRSSYECHRKIVASGACDGVIVSTPKLAEVYGRLTDNVHVCQNSVDPDDWPVDPPHAPDGVLRVGWAGSASHGYDVADIRPALDWASRQKDVEVVVLGQLQPAGVKHRHIPWADSLADYRRNVCELDVILCPLRPSQWSDCKSDVKALEGVMGGAVPVVSRTEPFRPWWDTDAPCMVADSPKGFVKAVKHLVARREETAQLAREARAWVLKHRTIQRNIRAWREAIDGVHVSRAA